MRGQGRRVRGAISGLICGFGIAVLLQQFAVLPLTTAVLVGVPVGMALVGIALGWPRRGATPARPARQPVAAPVPAAPATSAPEPAPEPAPPEPAPPEPAPPEPAPAPPPVVSAPDPAPPDPAPPEPT